MLSPDWDPQYSRPSARPRYFRSSTGCLTCRRRKKKCDEAKPRCVACARNKTQCLWPTTSPSRHNRRQSDVSATVTWSRLAGSYILPLRASMLTEYSNTLFAHYLEETEGLLSTLPPDSDNPFLSLIVPVCCNDDLLLHSLLALSGAHLSFRDTGIEVYVAMCRHYSIAIRTLRVAVGDLEGDDESRILRILLALMILSFCETLSGNTQAAMFSNFRASRRLILQLMESPLHSRPDDSGQLFRFILEVHCYFVLINNITPFGAIESRTLPYDPFLDFVDGNRSDASGAIFNGSHGLFEILPSIAMLSARRLTEAESLDHARDNAELYTTLQNRIVNWTPPPVISSDKNWQVQRETALELCREATLLYLGISMSGSVMDNPGVRDKVQNHIDVIMGYADLAVGSP